MDAWKRGMKSRLRDIVSDADLQRPGGSQRKLAAKWLGDASKAPQVSEWCSDKVEGVPGTENLYRLRQRCGTDLNWLVSGPAKPGEEGGEWPAERRAALADEMGDFAVHVLSECVRRKRLPLSPDPYRDTGSLALLAVRGDFLRHFTAELEKLTDRAASDARHNADALDAETYRRERRAARRKRG